MQKMSIRKTKIAKRLEAFNVVFDGQKTGGVYTIGVESFSTLDEIEAYIDGLEKGNAQQSVAEVAAVETVKPAESWQDWENALKPSNKMSEQTISLKCYKDNEPVYIEVKGFKKGGLAVHRHLSKHGHYIITHLETSIAFSSFKMNKKQAIEWLEESAKLLDWTKMDPFAVGNGKYCVEVPRIAMRITGSPVY